MAKIDKDSTTSIGLGALLTDYADGIAGNLLAPHLVRRYPARIDGDITSDSLVPNPDPEDSDGEDEEGKSGRKGPTLMDIEQFSNTFVTDPEGNSTATVTFKVRNSSGETVKAVDVLVQRR